MAQPGNADRAEATATSTSTGVANAQSATTFPVAGSTIWCIPPPVVTSAPSIQLLAIVMTFTLADLARASYAYPP
ncbi:hypothetical protein JCM12141A_60670 [Mycolicibacterium hodleri]